MYLFQKPRCRLMDFLFSYPFRTLQLWLVNWMTDITPLSPGLRTEQGTYSTDYKGWGATKTRWPQGTR